MASEVTCVGYACPCCNRRLPVLRSFDPPKGTIHFIASKCECGLERVIRVSEIQDLDTWKEKTNQSCAHDVERRQSPERI